MMNHLFKNVTTEPAAPVPPMSTKSYLARSVDEAIAQAREELGPEAMLLNTRKLAADQGLPGGYEVVFGVAEPQVDTPLLDPQRPPALQSPQPASEDLAADLERLHSQMDEIRDLLTRPAKAQPGKFRAAPELAGVYDRLIESEVDPALSKDIVDRLGAPNTWEAFLQRPAAQSNAARRGQADYRGKPSLNDPDTLDAFVLAELERRVGIEPRLGQNNASMALVGPPGAGKSTTLAKLAALGWDFAGTRPVRLLALSASNASLLPSLAAEAARRMELLLIDTPGYSSADWKAAEAAAAALTGCPGVETHLVVPGYMKAIDLRNCIQRYEIFRPSKLLVTKLDETHSFGSVFSEAARAGLALSFLTNGPTIPRDIRPASSEDLLALAAQRHAAARPANVA